LRQNHSLALTQAADFSGEARRYR